MAFVAGCSKPASTTPASDAASDAAAHQAHDFKAYKALWDKPVQEFVVSGDWAFERYSYKSVDTPKDGGAAVEDTGWGFVVYHHDADGKWRVARDAWGPDHPAAAP